MSIIPKQAIENGLNEANSAFDELLSKVQINVEQRVTLEGTTLNASIGTEKDGFIGLSAATTKGSANEGPAIALMGAKIKEGNITKVVSAAAKLSSVTGGTKGQSAVLNETIVQGSPKGIIQGLKDVANVPVNKIKNAVSESSPIPSKCAEVTAIVSVNKDALDTNTASEVIKTSENEQNRLKEVYGKVNDLGQKNLFGSLGSKFGNIMAQVTAVTQNAPSVYQGPQIPTKLSNATTVLDENRIKVPTPNLTRDNGQTTLSKAVTKSKTTNPAIQPSKPPVNQVDVFKTKWNGILTQTSVEVDGGFEFPQFKSKQHMIGELSKIDRPITMCVIYFFQMSMPKRRDKLPYWFEKLHRFYRKHVIKKFGEAAVNADPKGFSIPAHVFIEYTGKVVHGLDFNQVTVSTENGKRNEKPGEFRLTIDCNGHDEANHVAMAAMGEVIDCFQQVFPAAQIVGASEVRENVTNNPPFDVAEYVLSRNRTARAVEDAGLIPVEPVELVDLSPTNVTLPKKPGMNRLPNISNLANNVNKTVTPTYPPIPAVDYPSTNELLAGLNKQKFNTVNLGEIASGSGLLNALKPKVLDTDNIITNAIKGAIDLKIDNLKDSKIFNVAAKVFK